MAWPDTGNAVSHQVLDALSVNFAAIAAPDFATDVVSSRVHEVNSVYHSKDAPQVIIVPGDASPDHSVTGKVYYERPIDIICTQRVFPDDPLWSERMENFLADIGLAIEKDAQLGGLAEWVETRSSEVFDLRPSSPLVVGRVRAVCAYGHAELDPSIPT